MRGQETMSDSCHSFSLPGPATTLPTGKLLLFFSPNAGPHPTPEVEGASFLLHLLFGTWVFVLRTLEMVRSFVCELAAPQQRTRE
jgi:hypothetical protein